MAKKGTKKAAPVVEDQEDDVQRAEDGSVIGTENDKRLAMYNQIADGNDRQRAEEFYEVDDDGNTTGLSIEAEAEEQDEEESDGSGEENDQDTEESGEEDDGTSEEESSEESLTKAPAKYTITVNGVQKELTLDELVARAQKVESADDYLREASQLNQQAKQLRNPPQQQVQEEEKPEDEVALARAIQMGSEEEAVAAIRKLRSTGPSSDDLARTIDERLNFQTSVAWFQKEYNDITSDPVLAQMAIQQDNMLRAQGDQRPYVQRYKEIGEGLRNWIKSKAPAPTESEEKDPEVKVESQAAKKTRKAAAPSVPKPAASKVTVPEAEEEEESVQDTIANMAKSRGGPQWLRS